MIDLVQSDEEFVRSWFDIGDGELVELSYSDVARIIRERDAQIEARVLAALPEQARAFFEVRRALERLEWITEYVNAGVYGQREWTHCRLCDQTPERGHAPDCIVGAALRSAAERAGRGRGNPEVNDA